MYGIYNFSDGGANRNRQFDFNVFASELFNSLSGFSKKPGYRKVAVAPAGLG